MDHSMRVLFSPMYGITPTETTLDALLVKDAYQVTLFSVTPPQAIITFKFLPHALALVRAALTWGLLMLVVVVWV